MSDTSQVSVDSIVLAQNIKILASQSRRDMMFIDQAVPGTLEAPEERNITLASHIVNGLSLLRSFRGPFVY